MKGLVCVFVFGGMLAIGWLLPPGFGNGDISEGPTVTQSERELRTDKKSQSGIRADLQRLKMIPDGPEKWRQLIFLATSLPAEELAALCATDALHSLDDPYQSLFRDIILERWVEHDPEAMLTWSKMVDEDEVGVEYYLAKWASSGQAGVMAFLEESPVSQRLNWKRNFFRELMRFDPDRGFDLAMETLGNARGANPLGYSDESLVVSMAKHNIERFQEERSTWSDEVKKSSAPALATALMLEDFEAGMSFLRSEELGEEEFAQAVTGDSSGKILAKLLENWSEVPRDWREKVLTRAPGHLSASGGLDLLLQGSESLGLKKEQIHEFAERFLRYQGTGLIYTADRRKKLMSYLNSGQTDPEVAATTFKNLVRDWSPWDEEGLQEWIGQVTNERLGEVVEESLLTREERTKPIELQNPKEQLLKLASGESEESFQSGRWSQQELSEANQAFQQLDQAGKSRSYETFSKSSFGSLPVKFKSLVLSEALQNASSDKGAQELVNAQLDNFVGIWSESEPAKAANWTENLPEGDERLRSRKKAVEVWLQYAPEEARAWVESLPPQEQSKLVEK